MEQGLYVAQWVKALPRLAGRAFGGTFWLLGAAGALVLLALVVGLFLRVVLSVAL